jgi:hypothetical protein
MERRRHHLHRSRTISFFHSVYSNTANMRQVEGQAKAQMLSPPQTFKRARSWAVVPPVDISMTSPALASSLTNQKRLTEPVSSTLRVPSLSSPLQASDASRSPISPFIRGVIYSSLAYEAMVALILSINIRELVGNGADALVKALVKKTVTLAAALLLAMLLDCATSAMPMLGIDALLEMEIRGAAGIVSGWLGQQAGDPLGWKIEERIAKWIWPQPPRIAKNAESINPACRSRRPLMPLSKS